MRITHESLLKITRFERQAEKKKKWRRVTLRRRLAARPNLNGSKMSFEQ